MRKSLLLYSAALLLPLAQAAHAQQAATAGDAGWLTSRWASVGFRSLSSDGDVARLERYRDFGTGALVSFGGVREQANSLLQFSASNVGYRDQQYTFSYNSYGKLKLNASFNSVPLNYGYNTLTPFKYAGNNVWTLDAATRTNVQNKVPGVLGIGTTAANYPTASVYRGLATPFAIQSRRDVANVDFKYRPTELTSLNVAFSSTHRTGNQPYGAGFAFNDVEEIPMAIDNTTNDLTTAFEWADPKVGMFRAGWAASWFSNQFQSLTWDNPLRATDFSNGKAPPTGPYDPSGYSNGNGPATGRLAMPPSNSMNAFNFSGLYKMPGRTTLNGHFVYTTMRQDEALIPWTTNTSIANSAVYTVFPGLAALPRATADAVVHAMNATVNFTTRPTDKFGFDMKYRFNDHENRTQKFDASYHVRFDAVPEDVAGLHNEHFNIRQNTIETGATWMGIPSSTLRFGYIFDDIKRESRVFADMTDYTFRASFDSYRNQYVTVRAMLEDTRRVGDGFIEASLEDGGAQPGLRYYDEADMHRTKGTVVFDIAARDWLNVGLTFASAKDIYGGEGHEFGLLDNANTSYNLAFDFTPSKKLSFGFNYGMDKFSSLQKARNANPPVTTGAYDSWSDPNRDWNLDNDEDVTNAGLYLALPGVMKNTDVKISYDFSDSDNSLFFFGPRIQELITNKQVNAAAPAPCSTGQTTCFAQLPNVTNSWSQLRFDASRMFSKTLGVGIAYWYEKFEVTDWATVNLDDGTPRIDLLGTITTGYGNRPYTGNVATLRLIYTF